MVKTFISYPGNKTKLLKQILPLVPKEYNTYYEPMVGSGALFLTLEPKKAVINDINKSIINVWEIIKTQPYELLVVLMYIDNCIKENNLSQPGIDKMINILNHGDGVKKAAIKIYLHGISYMSHIDIVNNLYVLSTKRIDKRAIGRINRKATKLIYSIKKSSELLKDTKIHNEDYKNVIKKAKKGDFVYIDPPYHCDNKNNITYNKLGEQNILNELKEQIDFLTENGVYVMISNSDTHLVKNVFRNYDITTIKVYRPFKNKYATELIIRNYS